MEHNDYPPNALPGTLPPGMESYFGPSFDFSAPTPIGGSWDWVNRRVGTLIGVSVFSPSVDSAQLEEIDAIIDDGDLSHGAFTRTGSERLVLRVE